MNKYEVTRHLKLTLTYIIEAESINDAEEKASDDDDILSDMAETTIITDDYINNTTKLDE